MLNYKTAPLGSNKTYSVSLIDKKLSIQGSNELHLQLDGQNCYSIDTDIETRAVAIEALFAADSSLNQLTINGEIISRDSFYQLPTLWLRDKTNEESTLFPKRPPHFHGVHYKRFIPAINKTIKFRTISLADLDIFHEWHNQKRVAFFWELNQEKEELEKYIKDGLDKKHQIPMIVELDDTPVGYFEFYWVKEDRLGPYYDARPYDRGFHFLIGNKRFLGKANTDAITHSALHFIYLDDQRTDYVMAEPRYDNNKVLKYADETIGWDALKVFDFPHKRAVLLQNTRTRFFKGARL